MLTEAFPCLIIGIRELGEFIPLEPNLFDLVIIDEASQVSIAQAFPAILRGKKVIVLGDPKQYSNVKSSNASKEVNNFLFNKVLDSFSSSIGNMPFAQKNALKDKVKGFNIKQSILEFLRNISNYECTLRKHFRGYIELMGYSNQTFYQGSLQVMKIRGKPITETIKFVKIEADSRQEVLKNTNTDEAKSILQQLKNLKEDDFKGTVGIITPFREQHKILTDAILESNEYDFFRKRFGLKIMTFDSCQGDEKDIIFYSMVEKEGEDTLKYIFPAQPIETISYDDDVEKLKYQRLNVGFSRAKEKIIFVISKDVALFKGSIGQALKKFKSFLDSNDPHVKVLQGTDERSLKEPELYNFITQTQFYQENNERIEIQPQFEVGKFIKQIDPYAVIPEYVSDFLMIFRGEDGNTKSIIIEYDGLNENHFRDIEQITSSNYTQFYTDEHIERRKIIESYGYPFLRFNKFNLRKEPIKFIDTQLDRVFKKKRKNKFLSTATR